MPEKPTALVVDDDDEWLSILEQTLMPGFRVLKAKSVQEVFQILEDKDVKLEIALVDIRLNDKREQDRTGLEVMFILNERGIPCIGATIYNDAESTRRALTIGGAKDIWFKDKEETLVDLRNKIRSVIENEKKTLRSTHFQPVAIKTDPRLVFVVMPFGETWSDEVWLLIQSAADKHRLEVIRADDIFEPHIIVNDIWQMINKAGLIIADITTHNANVFYELGIAHTLEKEVVLIRGANGARPPFDISHWRYFEYELMPSKAKAFERKLSKYFQDYGRKHSI